MWWPFPQQAFAKAWFLPCFTVCARQVGIVVYENYPTSDILSLKFTAVELSSDFYVLSCSRTSIWRRNGRWQKKFASVWIMRSFDCGLPFCRLEEMKLWSPIFCAQAWNTRSDDVSDLSIARPVSDFWQSAIVIFFTLGDLDKVWHGNA